MVTGTLRIITLGSSGAFSLAFRLRRFSFHSSSCFRAFSSSSFIFLSHVSRASLHALLPDACGPTMTDISPSCIRFPSQYSTVTLSAYAAASGMTAQRTGIFIPSGTPAKVAFSAGRRKMAFSMSATYWGFAFGVGMEKVWLPIKPLVTAVSRLETPSPASCSARALIR